MLIRAKWLEVALMIAAAASLWLFPTNLLLPFVILGLMGVQSALFSPAKYGSLPELLHHGRLSAGNGQLEMWSMLAIILGTGLGPMLLFADGQGASPENTWLAAVGLVALSLVGLAAIHAVPPLPARGHTTPIATTVVRAWAAIRADRMIWLATLGSVIYWATVSLLGQNMLVYAKTLTLGLDQPELFESLPVAAFGLGIALGALSAALLSGDQVEYGLIPLGAKLFTAGCLLIAVLQTDLWLTTLIAVPLGMGAGMLLVPLNAIVQWRAPEAQRGSVIAVGNMLVYSGMVTGSLTGMALAFIQFDAIAILYATALIAALATAWSIYLLPDALVRLLAAILARLLYRVTVVNRHHLPATGAALLTPNHVTWVDGLWLLSTTDRPIRFLVAQDQYDRWWMRPIFRALQAIPIDPLGGPRPLLRALRKAGAFLDAGELLCIFPEGQLSRTAQLQPFRRGVERLVKNRPIPVIPIYIDRAWGSIFSFAGGKYLTKLPTALPYPVTIAFGEPLTPPITAPLLRQAVHNLGEIAWQQRRADMPTLAQLLVNRLRHGANQLCMGDVKRPSLTKRRALAGAVAIARALRGAWAEQTRVGILLPASVAGALTNFAAVLAGKTSVNLNFTAGQSALTSAARQADLKTVITSREFVEKAKVSLPDGVTPIYLEDVGATITGGQRLWALALATVLPVAWLMKACGATTQPTLDSVATVIFSSGSTGEPKGIELTHANIWSNATAVSEMMALRSDDRLLAILPLFHSFGYLLLWFGLTKNLPLVFHANPLDVQMIGRLVLDYRVTLLIATPTFLQIYLRRIDPMLFGSLRLVLTGAEKLQTHVADNFEKRFGIRPVEGYGVTECSPAIAASGFDYRGVGVYQPGTMRGSVGQLLNGVAVRIVDLETETPLGPNQEGMLWVKGMNVMVGYLNRPDLTEKVLRDGWYITGDLAKWHPDGFLFITDRLSRFSKIGGEMVPHGRIEEALHQLYQAEGLVFAVTGITDAKKGEKIAVLHVGDENRMGDLLTALGKSGFPNLFIPRRENFIKVDALPLLGTGKLDLRQLKAIAQERLSEVAKPE